MGYMTDFTLEIQIPETELKDTKAARVLFDFINNNVGSLDIDVIAKLIGENLEIFNLGEKPTIEGIMRRLTNISGYDSWDDNGVEQVLYESKWYDHEKDMVKLSKEFPNVIFHLSGDGEEQGDVWKEIYSGGAKQKSLKAKIVFEEE